MPQPQPDRAGSAGHRAKGAAYKPPKRPKPAKPIPTSQKQIPLFSRASIGRLVGGASGGALCFYVFYLYIGVTRDHARVHAKEVPPDTSDRYNFTADCFDDDVDFMEARIGVKSLRHKLCMMARGHVLEASVGTGRNMEYLPLTGRRITSVTMVDKSREMIEVARRKWPDVGNAFFIRTTFRVQDLASETVPCPSPAGFDTVLQTMGVCSTGEPVKMLQNLASMVNPDGGKILLLEHGRSTWGLVNRFLDYTSKAHADRHGCWYNKDVAQIVRDSGLEIVEEKRFSLGTTYWYVLKPPPKKIASLQPSVSASASASEKKSSSWFGFGG